MFIAFEGLDGSGKSTQIALLTKALRADGFAVHATREPTTSPIGSLIHQMMTGRVKSDHGVIAGTFAADRLDHILNDVDGMLEKAGSGHIVISDRYYFSSYAYHSTHLPLDWIIATNSIAASIMRP